MLVVLVTFGVICHAQMRRPDASVVKSCDTELAICQALLGAVRAKEATNVVRLAAITPSLNPNGARTHPPAAVWPSHARTAGAKTACSVQSRVRSSARTRAARCSRPTSRSIARRAQRAARRGCGSVECTAVRAGARPARPSGVSPSHHAYQLYPQICGVVGGTRGLLRRVLKGYSGY